MNKGEIKCKECGKKPQLVKVDYDGIKIACECKSTHISSEWLRGNAPDSWIYNDRYDSEKKLR